MKSNSPEWFADPAYWIENRSFIWSDCCIEMTSKSVSKIIELLGIRIRESVLDLACGFGRHSFEFQKQGLSVTGADLNPEILLVKRAVLDETPYRSSRQGRCRYPGVTRLGQDGRIALIQDGSMK